MRKNLLFVFIAIMFAGSLAYGQSHRELPIYRNFNGTPPDSANTLDSTDVTYGGWSTQSVTGDAAWYVGHYNTNYYAHCNGYEAAAVQEQWFISPGFSTVDYPNASLRFSSCQKFEGNSIEILVSSDYDGTSLPSVSGNWTNITADCVLPPLNPSGPRVWYNSGYVSLSAFSGANVYVGFKYTCTASLSTDWEVDSIQIINSAAGFVEASNNSGFSVYPNPATTSLHLNNIEGDVTVRISNILGEEVKTLYVAKNATEVNVSDLNDGVYFVAIINKDGSVVTKKFTKE